MRTLNSRCSTFAPLAIAIAASATSARAETINCTPITAVPYTITVGGVYCLTNNIATPISSGHAIEIQANNVTLDMNGFKLGGLAAGLGTGATGIHANQRQNITIRNGIVRGFYRGVWLEDVSPYTTSQGHLVEDVVADQNTFAGIQVQGRGCVVRRNQVVATGGSTLWPNAVGIYVLGPENDILDNRVSGTKHTDATFGVIVESASGSVVEGNRISGDMSGLVARGIFIDLSTDVLVVGNRITTADNGISYYNSSTGKYMDNLTSGVTIPASGATPVGINN